MRKRTAAGRLALVLVLMDLAVEVGRLYVCASHEELRSGEVCRDPWGQIPRILLRLQEWTTYPDPEGPSPPARVSVPFVAPGTAGL